LISLLVLMVARPQIDPQATFCASIFWNEARMGTPSDPLPTRYAHIEEFVVDPFAIWIKSASFVFSQKSKVRNQEADPKNCQKKRTP
jgi:hypothetical protein